MTQLKRVIAPILVLTLAMAIPLWSGTTGKIAGTIIDKSTGESLPGANVAVVKTSLGAAADLNGQYTILHIPPGVYEVQVSFMGYRKTTISDVRVYIDQTTRVDVGLEVEALQIGEAVIVAEREIIKPDVATSVVSVSDKEVRELPVSNVVQAIGLQAGISGGLSSQLNGSSGPTYLSGYSRGRVSVQGDLSIRGGGGDNILFQMDGVTLRDPRNNEPITKVALSAVQEISVERGGFNAEYGQVRSGIVNVVTKEGSKKGYFGSVQSRVRPPGPKYWRGDGIYDIHDPNSYIMRPFFDDAVAWTGTLNGAWDEYTRRQYPEFNGGWNEISRILNTDSDPTNDLTPLGAQRAFMYETRKKQINDQPDYEIDTGFGGPVPFVSEKLGGLRFFGSYRGNREMLLVPLTRPDYRDYDWTLQMTSDITPSMKLRVSTLQGKQFTIRHNWDSSNNAGIYFYPRRPSEVAGVIGMNSTSDLIILFSDFNFALSDIGHRSYAAKLTHTLNSRAFYEVSLEHFRRDYYTRPAALRDTTQQYEVVPGFFEDSNPFGYWPLGSRRDVLLKGSQHVSKSRDNSEVSSTTFKVDFTGQLNFQNLVKAGIEFDYNDLDFDYGVIGSAIDDKTYSQRVQMRVLPIRAAAYLQDKLETKGFTMNAGLRLDYSDSKADWFDVDPFNPQFFSSSYNRNRVFEKIESTPQWQVSPRLGIAHPITESSKLFFNYGHFKQVPQYESLFRIERSDSRQMTSFGDPNLILAKTISYELGYDQILYHDFLLQLAAFYSDITDQQDFTEYTSSSGGYSYTQTTSNNYEDVRGFEATLRKTSGRWYSGFANFTYQVTNTGHFGSAQRYDNPAQQKSYDEYTLNLYQDRPIPRPNARANINLYTPSDFGPSLLGGKVLGGFKLNVLLDWQAGYWTTWSLKDQTVAYNVKSRDFFNVALRLDKTVDFREFRLQFFVDMNNALNTRRLWNTGDFDYMSSLHLPQSEAYDNIPGNDKVGDYREPGVEFQPMEYQSVVDQTQPGHPRPIYFEGTTGKYWQYVLSAEGQTGQWTEVDQKRIDQVLKDNAYIDMPNASTFWFLDPRQIFFGMRLSFDLTE